MTLIELLQKHRIEIITNASTALTRAPLRSYKKAGSAENTKRLQKLFDVVLESIKKNTLIDMIKYAKQIAADRIKTGYEIFELQAAFNVLEEVIWQIIIQKLPQKNYAEALRLVSTTLGAGKETLANSYVELASKLKEPLIDNSALFEGTEGI